MASKGQMTGMRGVFLVAAELAGQGLTVSVTSRNALGADILVTDAMCKKAYSVQVKTNGRPRTFWLVGKKAMDVASPSHVYALVNLRPDGQHDYYIVPSKIVMGRTDESTSSTGTDWHSISVSDVIKFKNAWHHVGGGSDDD